jgi:hypothetical protein
MCDLSFQVEVTLSKVGKGKGSKERTRMRDASSLSVPGVDLMVESDMESWKGPVLLSEEVMK